MSCCIFFWNIRHIQSLNLEFIRIHRINILECKLSYIEIRSAHIKSCCVTIVDYIQLISISFFTRYFFQYVNCIYEWQLSTVVTFFCFVDIRIVVNWNLQVSSHDICGINHVDQITTCLVDYFFSMFTRSFSCKTMFRAIEAFVFRYIYTQQILITSIVTTVYISCIYIQSRIDFTKLNIIVNIQEAQSTTFNYWLSITFFINHLCFVFCTIDLHCINTHFRYQLTIFRSWNFSYKHQWICILSIHIHLRPCT